MLSLMAGANLSASHGVTPFNDVETNAWYAPAATVGRVIGESLWGRSEDQFCPEDSITRGRSGGNAFTDWRKRKTVIFSQEAHFMDNRNFKMRRKSLIGLKPGSENARNRHLTGR